jgi:hypothetical protein
MAIQAGETTFYQAKRGIVQDGLVLNLDAAVDASYSGGTTWRDLAGSNNGTLANMNDTNLIKDNGGSLSFDGTDEYINVGNNSDLQITGEITVSAWIKAGVQINMGIAGKYSAAGGQRGYLIATNNHSTNRKITWYYQRTASSFNGLDSVTSISDVLDGNWHFVLCTFTPSTSANIYIDGEFDIADTDGIQSSIANNTSRFDIGTHGQSTSTSFTGDIASVSVYNRTLTSDEVARNYNATRHRFGV